MPRHRSSLGNPLTPYGWFLVVLIVVAGLLIKWIYFT